MESSDSDRELDDENNLEYNPENMGFFFGNVNPPPEEDNLPPEEEAEPAQPCICTLSLHFFIVKIQKIKKNIASGSF